MRSPARRTALAICTALLLVTAGCSGWANPSGTATPTDTATATWSPNASVEQYPPGVADNGTLTNVSTLLDAHADATANEPTELAVEWTRGTDSFARRYVRGADPTPYYSTFNRTTDGMRVTEEFYGTGSHGYGRITFDNQTVYSVVQNATTVNIEAWTRDSSFGPREDLRGQLVGGNYSVNGTVERGDRTFVQLTADEASPARADFYAAYEGTVLVTPEGVVYGIDASYSTGTDGEERHTDVSIALDTDVTWSGPPSWVADAPHLSLSIVEDGHALEIRNTGGAALPANASLHVAGANQTVWGAPFPGDASGTVTTDARLEPGDAVYVTAGADGDPSSFALHDEPTRGEYTFGAAGVRGTQGNVNYRLATGIKNPDRGSETTYRTDLLSHSLGPENRTIA